MNFQPIIVALIILAALCFIGQRVWNKSKAFSNSKNSSCGSDCGCGK